MDSTHLKYTCAPSRKFLDGKPLTIWKSLSGRYREGKPLKQPLQGILYFLDGVRKLSIDLSRTPGGGGSAARGGAGQCSLPQLPPPAAARVSAFRTAA